MQLEFLIIDPQIDFCDPGGSLFVPGADEDMRRLSEMITRLGSKVKDIHVTLDSHHYVDIAHPVFWINGEGKHPNPFTLIDEDYHTTNPQFQDRADEYRKQLANNKRYLLCIWPPHCLIGSEGYGVVPSLYPTLLDWEKTFKMVDYVTKGSNLWTEHYSAVQADVPDPQDPGTMLNTKLIETLERADIVVIAGEALSHCVANTVTDIADNFGDENIKKMVLLEDCTSNVPTFEKLGTDFVGAMKSRGMQVSNSVDFLK